MVPVEDAIQLHDVNVHWLELEMVGGEEGMEKAMLEELIDEEVDADQLHNVNARVLQFVTISIPVMYIGIPAFDEAVALKVDLCTTNDALFLSERFTSITSFPLPV